MLERLAAAGAEDFYRGDVARAIAAGFEKADMVLTLADLEGHRARHVEPLSLQVFGATVWTMPPPTQGLAALMVLGLFARLGVAEAEGFDHVHGIVESIKQAYVVRDAHLADPATMRTDAASFLEDSALDRLAAAHRTAAAPWPGRTRPRRRIPSGSAPSTARAAPSASSRACSTSSARASSCPASVSCGRTRGAGFTLAPDHPNCVRPGQRPFHTLCPYLAGFGDGRLMALGTRGADGQPQTLAALFSRYALFGQTLQQAVTAPRWRLGANGASSLALESRFADDVIGDLRNAGHEVRLLGPFDSVMGHAGALVRHPSGLIEGAADPRSDGVVAAF